jgi:AraC-like DNA-binding protein
MDARRKNMHNRRMLDGFKHWFPRPSPPAGATGFRVHGIGWREPMPAGFVDRPRGTGDYLFMRFDDAVTFQDAGGRAARPAGCMAIWPPGAPQRYGRREGGYRHSWLHCRGPFVAKVLRDCRLPVNRAFLVRDPAGMDDALLAMHGELAARPDPDAVLVRNAFESWLHRLARDLAEGASPGPPPGLLEAKRRMESSPERAWRLPELAAAAGFSRQHFGELFRQHFGAPPIAHLIRSRLRLAAHLLRDRNRRVGEVARAAGFADPFHFSRCFRREYGLSPRAWRSRWSRGPAETPAGGRDAERAADGSRRGARASAARRPARDR